MYPKPSNSQSTAIW